MHSFEQAHNTILTQVCQGAWKEAFDANGGIINGFLPKKSNWEEFTDVDF